MESSTLSLNVIFQNLFSFMLIGNVLHSSIDHYCCSSTDALAKKTSSSQRRAERHLVPHLAPPLAPPGTSQPKAERREVLLFSWHGQTHPWSEEELKMIQIFRLVSTPKTIISHLISETSNISKFRVGNKLTSTKWREKGGCFSNSPSRFIQFISTMLVGLAVLH